MDNVAQFGGKLPIKIYLKRADYVFFCLSTFGTGALNGMVAAYLLIFYTAVLGISPIITGTMFLIAKVWDGINDPIMGIIVDRTRSKYGKMKPYLLFGAVPFGIVVVGMFLPVTAFPMAAKIAFMYISYILFDITSTIVTIPLFGLPTVISPNPKERDKLLTFSQITNCIGEQSSLVIISVLFLITKNNQALSYFATAATIGILAPVFMILAGKRVEERVEQSDTQPSLWEGIKYMFVNKNLFFLIITTLLSFFRGLVTGAVIYYVLYVIGNGSLQIWFSLPLGLSSFVGMLLVPILKKKFSSKTLFIGATIWYSVGLIIIWLLQINTWWILAISMFFIMAATGFLNITPNLMAADTIDDWENRKGIRQEGITFAVISMRTKLSSGLYNFFFGFY
ncbi:MAG: glycoside-pentoside-hexuronide (GPH):cation symporter [Clostridia bacterium]